MAGGGDTVATPAAVASLDNPQACFTGPAGTLNLGQNYQTQDCSTGLALTAAQVEATGLQTADSLVMDFQSSPAGVAGQTPIRQ